MIGKFAVPASSGGGGGGGTYSTVLREYTASGTWDKPSGLVALEIFCVGGGGGGSSGHVRASGVVSRGGSGGASGGCTYATLYGSDLTSQVSYTIGAGGTGGASVSTIDSNGNTGGAGSSTSFGSYLSATGGAGGLVNGGQGAGVSSVDYTCVSYWKEAGIGSSASGGSGSSGTSQTTNNTSWLTLLGGAGGGGLTTANATGSGGSQPRYLDRAGAQTPSTTLNTPGSSAPQGPSNVFDRFCASDTSIGDGQALFIGVSGGGGGSGGTNYNAGNGGNGGLYGAAGGGGGGARNSYTSGAGGNGAAGLIILVEHIVS